MGKKKQKVNSNSTSNTCSSKPGDPVAGVLESIRALNPENNERLFRCLLDWQPEQMSGWRLVGARMFEDLVQHAEGWLHALMTASGGGQPTNRRSADGILGASIGALDLSVRVHNIIRQQIPDAQTIGDLLLFSEYDLLELRNFGRTCLQEVRMKLAEYGLALKNDDW